MIDESSGYIDKVEKIIRWDGRDSNNNAVAGYYLLALKIDGKVNKEGFFKVVVAY